MCWKQGTVSADRRRGIASFHSLTKEGIFPHVSAKEVEMSRAYNTNNCPETTLRSSRKGNVLNTLSGYEPYVQSEGAISETDFKIKIF